MSNQRVKAAKCFGSAEPPKAKVVQRISNFGQAPAIGPPARTAKLENKLSLFEWDTGSASGPRRAESASEQGPGPDVFPSAPEPELASFPSGLELAQAFAPELERELASPAPRLLSMSQKTPDHIRWSSRSASFVESPVEKNEDACH